MLLVKLNPTALRYRAPEPQLELQAAQAALTEPDVFAQDQVVYEDSSVGMNFQVNMTAPQAGDFLTVTVSGIDPSWGVDTSVSGGTYDSAAGTWTIQLPPGQNFSGGPVLSPPADSDADHPGTLTIDAETTRPSTGETTTDTGTQNIVTDAVADVPDLVGAPVTGLEDTAIPLNISVGVTDTDGSEEISYVIITNVPLGGTLSAGLDLGSGIWRLTEAEVTGLTLTPPADYSGTFTLTVQTQAEEVNLDGAEPDLTNNRAWNAIDMDVTVTAVADEPTLEVQDALIKEDTSVTLAIEAAPGDIDGSETLTVTIEDIPADWTMTDL